MSSKAPTPATIKAALNIIQALAEAIRDLGSVPNGHLYAHVMGSLSLSEYTEAIELLKRSKLVSEENHLLTWIGGKS